jgi:outer membrane protein TolC
VEPLVEAVVARNPSLAQMEAAQQVAAARYPQVTSLDDPMLGLMQAPGSIGRNDLDFGGRIEISQKFPWCGKRQLRGQAALAEASAAGQDVDDMRLQLVESARNAFYDYYLTDRALAVNEEGLQLLRELQKNAETRYKTGQVPQQDILQVEVELGRQREQRTTMERMRKVAVARINTLLHLPPDAPLPPPPAQVSLEQGLPPVEALRVQAIDTRPDLKAISERIRMEEASLALAHKDYCPDFEAIAAYDTMMGNGQTRPVAAQVGVRLNLPVRCARRQGAITEAEARIAQRRAELAARLDQVNFQVQEAYEQVVESETNARLYEETLLPSARNNIKAAQAAYLTGKVPFLTVIEAQRNLVELRDRSYTVLADYFRRRATLERMVGGPLLPMAGEVRPSCRTSTDQP